MDRVSQYQLLEQLGRGSYGTVFKAYQVESGATVAIKVVDVDQSSYQAIKREVEALMDCQDPCIIQMHESFYQQGKFYIVMEYANFGSLLDIMQKRGPFPESLISTICRNLLIALRYLHSRRRIHRDLKASNVLLTSEGEIKLADFGVAGKLIEQHCETLIGSPYWMAPEVVAQNRYDQKVDIWSLGMTMLELARGKNPLSELTTMAALFKIQQGFTPRFEQSSSENFKDFVLSCLVRDPRVRPDAEQLLNHPFVKGVNLDLMSLIQNPRHHRSNSSGQHTIRQLPSHRQSYSFNGNISIIPSESESDSSSSSFKTIVRVQPNPIVRMDNWEPKFAQNPSFLTLLETAVREEGVERVEGVDSFVVAAAQLEINNPNLLMDVFSRIVKVLKRDFPHEYNKIVQIVNMNDRFLHQQLLQIQEEQEGVKDKYGVHFEYQDLCRRLIELKQFRDKQNQVQKRRSQPRVSSLLVNTLSIPDTLQVRSGSRGRKVGKRMRISQDSPGSLNKPRKKKTLLPQSIFNVQKRSAGVLDQYNDQFLLRTLQVQNQRSTSIRKSSRRVRRKNKLSL